MPRFELLPAMRLMLGLLLLHAAPLLAREATCPAIADMQPMLNSERIQGCFGSYGVEVLEQRGRMRISSLYSLESSADGERRITRTLAVSEFAEELPGSLQQAYEAIRAGASMGATLKASGWRVDKRHRYFGEIPVNEAFRCLSGLPADHSTQVLAVQVYDLWVVREDQEVRFALLAELHDPRYLTLADLRQLYHGLADRLQAEDAASAAMLQRMADVCATR